MKTKIGSKEQKILDYIQTVSPSEYDIMAAFAPRRKNSETHWAAWEYYKVRIVLRRMEKKLLIWKDRGMYQVGSIND